jgi:catechol 2,3-dioxygenase-like lactoylglutathione lyase family enzyme
MRIVLLFLTAVMLFSSNPSEQSTGGNAVITYGHHHLNVTSVAEHTRFWVDTLGGTPVKIGQTDNVKFPGVIVRLRPQAPTGGTKGTTVDHVGFQVPDLGKALAKVRTAGYPIVTATEVTSVKPEDVKEGIAFIPGQDINVAFTMGPDNVKVELVENKTLSVPIAMHQVHFAAISIDDMKAWYAKTFGGKAVRRGTTETLDLPDVSLRWLAAPKAPAGTRSRVLDHIGFEVQNLEAFCRQLEAQGVKFDRPYGNVPELGISVAFLTDPWGTYIELSEGLRKLVE